MLTRKRERAASEAPFENVTPTPQPELNDRVRDRQPHFIPPGFQHFDL
jgi:hypothetical protein